MRNVLYAVATAAALLFAPSVASAQSVTNTFNGVVTANAADGFDAPSTPDFADPFYFYPTGPFNGNGASLVGLPFKLTVSIDVSDPSSLTWDGVGIGSANYFQGASGYMGSYPYGTVPYYCCSPMTASLTINGQTLVFDDQTGFLPLYFTIATDGATNPNELTLQAFYWAECCGYGVQYFGLYMGLSSPTGAFGSDFTTPLPTLLASGDFTVNQASFYSIGGEVQNLDVLNVNGAVLTPIPEPSTWAMMALGFAGFGLLGRQRARLANAAS